MAYLLQGFIVIHSLLVRHGDHHAHTQQQELLIVVSARMADGQALRPCFQGGHARY